ncbi:MAG: maleylacetoacetate isomerase [Bdellovibrionaceae bacterium]|nr:maleylacetoacetate isomerase [Bdellovibrionales bacterium]MCB9086234.1 maleylacetoacetate isomerase [Pseudobdellovibrionaceae bacterium]
MGDFKLYSYYRSSCSYRVRIALNLKGIVYEYIPLHLVNEGGEQHLPAYRTINPKREVPTLVHGPFTLSQSMAIIEYLDQFKPSPQLFPKDKQKRALVTQFCEIINSGIQPIQNLSVLQELKSRFAASEADIQTWCADWIFRGFEGIEAMLRDHAGSHCFGGTITAADLFLVPQVYNAQRFKVDLSTFPIIDRVSKNAMAIDSFQLAEPSRQIDAPRT